MTLFLSLLPLYLIGNLHCTSMCGPLVMLLARHPFRWHYFLGRLASYSLVGLLCSEVGLILFHFLSTTHISAFLSLLFGAILFVSGVCSLFKTRLNLSFLIPKKSLASLSQNLFKHVSKNHPLSTFLFGFCTVLLPCGQTLVVFSACALDAVPLHGLVNGFLFALLTSPSLAVAMHALNFFKASKKSFHIWIAAATLLVGMLSLLRGFADLQWISHLALNSSNESGYHIVLF